MKASTMHLAALLCLCFSVTASEDVKAEWVWQQIGPPGAGDGLSAILLDTDDPNVVYFAGDSTVWVSDDGGETYNIVVQLGRSLTRRNETPDEEEGPEDTSENDDIGNAIPSLDPSQDLGRESATPVIEDATSLPKRRTEQLTIAQAKRKSINRLRILGDRVYVCGARGLVSFPRKARAYTIPRPEWAGRKEPVFDVLQRSRGGLWVATSNGLFEMDATGAPRSVAGMLSEGVVSRLLPGETLLVGTDTGLWRLEEGGFERVAALPRRRIIRDLLRFSGNIWVLTEDQLFRFSDNSYALREVIAFRGGQRMAVGRDQKLWLAADSGVWTLGGSGTLQPERGGISQSLFRDIASAQTGAHPLWVVGRGGAWRRTTEVERVLSERARTIHTVLKGVPTAYAVMEQVERMHQIHSDQLGAWKEQLATSWLLPKIDMNYTPIRRRVEWLSLLPTLDTYVFDEVRILPIDDEFRIVANWELFPPLFALLERGGGQDGSGLNEALNRSYQRSERLRRRTTPVYAAWLRALVKVRTSSPKNIQKALRERLELRRLSADLDVLTGGHFSQFNYLSQGGTQ